MSEMCFYLHLQICPPFQVYICELVHPDLRGVSAAIYAVTHALGYSFILLLGYVLPSWRYAMLAVAACAAPALVLAFFLPESPEWLVRKDRLLEAEESLRK